MPALRNLEPIRVVPGGRLWVHGEGFPLPAASADDISIAGVPARISFAAPARIAVVVPEPVPGGDQPVKVSWAPGATLYADVARVLATGLHQVDNPVLDARRERLCHLFRIARPAGGGVGLPRDARRRCASRSCTAS